MSVIIWHNPKCATSRKVLEMIRARSLAPKIIEYLKDPPTAAALKTALKEMGIKPRQLLRQRGTPYSDLGLDDPKWTDSALIRLMIQHPVLIERPVVRTGKGTRLCRPPERVKEIL